MFLKVFQFGEYLDKNEEVIQFQVENRIVRIWIESKSIVEIPISMIFQLGLR